MNSRLSPDLAEFAEGRWPDEGDRRAYGQRPADRKLDLRTMVPPDIEARSMNARDIDLEPPLHPSEFARYGNGRWTVRRRILAALGRFAPAARVRLAIAFCLGIAATLGWQAYGNGARRMAAGWSPRLGWLAPAATNAAGMSADQLAALSHSLAAVRQSVDRMAADVTRLQAAKPPDSTPLVRTSGPPASGPAATTGRKPPPAH